MSQGESFAGQTVDAARRALTARFNNRPNCLRVPPHSMPMPLRMPMKRRPTVSAMAAPRSPIGAGGPMVESSAVWCSISEFSSAPIRTTITEKKTQSMKPITAPSEP